jgi:hypothetical protein
MVPKIEWKCQCYTLATDMTVLDLEVYEQGLGDRLTGKCKPRWQDLKFLTDDWGQLLLILFSCLFTRTTSIGERMRLLTIHQAL